VEAAPRDAVDAPRPEAVRVCGEPYPSRQEELKPTASGGEPEQRKEQGAAVNTYTAPPSSTGRRRLHVRPAVSAITSLPLAPFPLIPCLWARLRAAVRRAQLFLYKWPPRRATLEGALHRGHPKPQRWALPIARRSAALLLPDRGTPLDTPPHCVPGDASCLAFLRSGLCAVVVSSSGECMRASWLERTPASQGQGLAVVWPTRRHPASRFPFL
jgi:hypothetical protein